MFDIPQGVSEAAEIIDTIRSEIVQNSRQSVSHYNHELENSLAVVQREGSSADWCIEGNEPVRMSTALTTRSFIETLPGRYQNPDIAPEPDGHISVEWYLEKRRLLTVSIGPDQKLYWAALIGNEDPRGSATFTGRTPPTVAFLLERIYSVV